MIRRTTFFGWVAALWIVLCSTLPAQDATDSPAAEGAESEAAAPDDAEAASEADSAEATSEEAKADTPSAANQDAPKEEPPAEEDSDDADAPAAEKKAAARWEKAFGDWKDLLAELHELRTEFGIAEPSELEAIRTKYAELLTKGQQMIPGLRAAATDAYLEAPNIDRQLARFLVKLIADDVRADKYDRAASLAKVMLDNDCDNKAVGNMAGIAAFALHDFDAAGKLLTQAAADDALSDDGQKVLPDVEEYKEYWKAEQEIRKKEAADDDLPRVRLTTSKGDIVVELFENEAPQTVGNFVSLVEKGFYDGLVFHRVLTGFMAQGGCPKGDGTDGPGYKIYCECYEKDYRKHFRGSLSMAHTIERDTGGSQFFLTFQPTGFLNGVHTAFGRVIEGMEVLSKLQRRDPDDLGAKPEPDKIVKAEVIRKRDHEYLPTKVK